MTTFPTLKVEIAFGDAPLETSPTWVDVSAYVRHEDGVEIDRGRNDPWSPFQPGRARFTLSNRDRRFDPTYAAGPYYGDLKPRVQVQITANFSATDYPVFRGWVAAWPQVGRASGTDLTVDVECYDALEWASSVRLNGSEYAEHVDSTIPGSMWLREVDATWNDALSGGYSPTLRDGVMTAAPSMAPGLETAAAVFNGSTWLQMANMFEAGLSVATWTAAFWVSTTATSVPIAYGDGGFNAGCKVEVDANGKLHFESFQTAGGNETDITSSITINDGLPHFVAIVRPGASVKVYIDGVEDTAAVTAASAFNVIYFDRVGGDGAATASPSAYFLGSLQEFILSTNDWTAGEVAAAYAYGLGFVTESTATRMARYLDDADWPAGWRDLTADPKATVGELAYNGQTLLTALRELERSEQGKVFAARDGDLTLLGRYHHQDVARGSTVQATFSDDGSDFAYMSWAYLESDVDVRNDVTVTTPTTQSRSRDATSITTYGRQSETVDTILSTYVQAKDMAAGLVNWWSDALGRVEPFTVGVVGSPNFGTMLGLELGDRVKVEATPMAVGSQFTKELLVDSISWRINAALWLLTLGGAPVPTQMFILGTSALGGADPLGF